MAMVTHDRIGRGRTVALFLDRSDISFRVAKNQRADFVHSRTTAKFKFQCQQSGSDALLAIAQSQ